MAAVAPNARLRIGTIVGARFVRYCCMKGLLRYSARSQLKRNRIRVDWVRIMIQAFCGNSHDLSMFIPLTIQFMCDSAMGRCSLLPDRKARGHRFLEVV